jgi:hypothetical protein
VGTGATSPRPKRDLSRPEQKVESTVRYLGIEVDDALEIAEQTNDRPLNCRANHLPHRRVSPIRDVSVRSPPRGVGLTQYIVPAEGKQCARSSANFL